MLKIKKIYDNVFKKLQETGYNNVPLDYFIDEYIIVNNLQNNYPLMDEKIKNVVSDEIKDLTKEELDEFYNYCIREEVENSNDITNDNYIKISMKLLKLENNDRFLDLGSGLGLILKYVLDNYNITKVTGIEIEDRKYLISKMILSKCSNVELINDDFNRLHLDFDKVFLNPGIHVKNYSNDSSFKSIETLIRLLKESKTDKRAAIILRGTHLYSNRFKENINSIIETGLVEGIVSCINFSNNIILILTTEKHDTVKLLDGHLNDEYNNEDINDIINSYFNGNNDRLLEVDNNILIDEDNINPSKIRNRIKVDRLIKKYKTVKLGDICDVFIGSQYTANMLEEKYEKLSKRNLGNAFKIVKATDIDNDGQLNYDNLSYYLVDKINPSRLARKNDILITSKTTNFKVCVLDDVYQDDFIIPSGGMFIIKPKGNIDPYYLKAYFDSNIGKMAVDNAFKGDKVRVLNLTSLQNVMIPILDNNLEMREVIHMYKSYMKRLLMRKKDVRNLQRANIKECNNLFK